MDKSMLVICEDYKAYDEVSNESLGKVFRGLLRRYAGDGDPEDLDILEKVIFKTFCAQVDRSKQKRDEKAKQRSEAGKKGAEAKASSAKQTQANASKTKIEEAKSSIPDPDPDPDPVPVSPSGILDICADAQPAPKPAKSVRHKYGQYQNVLLTDEQMAKLREECPTDWQERIERLSEYMASKGASYKDHLATIRAWKRKEGQNPPIRQQTGQAGQRPKNAFLAYNQRDTDYDALERELAKTEGV